MQRFLVRRLVFFLISLMGATVVMFSLSRTAQDPRVLFVPRGGYGITHEQWESLGRQMGFDKPVVVQYFVWLGRLLKGDLGLSLGQQVPVRGLVVHRLGATAQLALAGWILTILMRPCIYHIHTISSGFLSH